ncbi:MAG: hypothetical protein FD153_931 [Rhodospirillaceae bacterium]|nr:MAG: hypothetical protein FD153_931 [Rhodospirillaceae bacterium]
MYFAQFADSEQRTTEAVNMLQFALNGIGERDSAWGRAIAAETKIRQGAQRTCVYHEHLERDNTPLYFHQSIAVAEQHYLGADQRHRVSGAVHEFHPQPPVPIHLAVPCGPVLATCRRSRKPARLPPDIGRGLAPDFDPIVDLLQDDRPRTFGKGALITHNRFGTALFLQLHEQAG